VLQELFIFTGGIRNDGAESFAELFAEQTALVEVNFANNVIGESGAEAIAQSLQDNEKIVWMSLEQNGLKESSQAHKTIQRLTKRNLGIREEKNRKLAAERRTIEIAKKNDAGVAEEDMAQNRRNKRQHEYKLKLAAKKANRAKNEAAAAAAARDQGEL
jgi:hypothetical protein